MENKTKKNTLLTGALLAGAVAAFSISNVEARPATTTRVLGNGAGLRSEIINLNITSSSANVFEMQCGAGTTETTKTKKKGKTGEAKCGAKKKKAKKGDKKAAKKTDKKSKTTEGKCGQGKCGGSL